MKKLSRMIVWLVSIVMIFGCAMYSKGKFFDSVSEFGGQGSEEDPYIIDSYETLLCFQEMVNEGNNFQGKYFLQTENIDLNNNEWIPIGIYNSDRHFAGTYDGGGHFVKNLMITESYPYSPANVGFFGYLDGTVKNFGIESGSISGEYVGGITSHGSSRCNIINCYNKADIYATKRGGGICDDIAGSVVNCVYVGQNTNMSVISYNANFAISIFPEQLPNTYTGTYIQNEMVGESVVELLNSGIKELIERNILSRKDAISWR